MAKATQQTEVSTKRVANELAKPEWLQEQEVMGVEELKQYIRPSRLKVVQPLSGAAFKEQFNEGDVVLLPQMVCVAPQLMNERNKPTGKGAPFHVVPLFFFAEWCAWNPLQMKGTLPPIRDRSFDPNSAIARKAKVKELWFEPCPENPEYNVRYVEHLNYLMLVVGDNPAAGMEVVVGFSRGEYRSGSTFSGLLHMRNASPFGCIFEARVGFRTNPKGDWYGIDMSNPSAESGMPAWVADAEMYDKLRLRHLELKEAHAQQLIIVERDDDEFEEETGSTEM